MVSVKIPKGDVLVSAKNMGIPACLKLRPNNIAVTQVCDQFFLLYPLLSGVATSDSVLIPFDFIGVWTIFSRDWDVALVAC